MKKVSRVSRYRLTFFALNIIIDDFKVPLAKYKGIFIIANLQVDINVVKELEIAKGKECGIGGEI